MCCGAFCSQRTAHSICHALCPAPFLTRQRCQGLSDDSGWGFTGGGCTAYSRRAPQPASRCLQRLSDAGSIWKGFVCCSLSHGGGLNERHSIFHELWEDPAPFATRQRCQSLRRQWVGLPRWGCRTTQVGQQLKSGSPKKYFSLFSCKRVHECHTGGRGRLPFPEET